MARKKPDTVGGIVAICGGIEKVAKVCDISTNAINKWERFGFVPPKNWPLLVETSGGSVTYRRLEALWRASRAA